MPQGINEALEGFVGKGSWVETISSESNDGATVTGTTSYARIHAGFNRTSIRRFGKQKKPQL
jgi:hypothetical protein